MMPSSLIFAAALVAWGPVAPAPESAPSDAAPQPAAAVASPASVASSPPSSIATTIIARGPLDVRATPVLVAPAPRAKEKARPPLHKRWQFWVIAGGLFATSIAVTVAVTRPGPQAYTGNVPPYIVSFP